MEDKKSKLGIKIFFLFLFIYILFMSGHMGGDSFWVYLTTESIVLDRNLVLNDHPDRDFAIKELKDNYQNVINSLSIKDGKIISPYGIGLVIFEIPLFLVGCLFSFIVPFIPRDYVTMFFTSMINCFICALLCYVFYKICKIFNFSNRISVWLTSAFGLGSLVFPYSRQGFSEPLACLSLLGAIYFLFIYFKFNKSRNIILGGICFGIGILTRFDLFIYFPIIFLYIIYRSKNIINSLRKILLFSLPIVISTFIYLIHNMIRYGNYFDFGPQSKYFYSIFSYFPVDILINIHTLFFSSGSGLIIYMPILLLFIWSISYFLKKYRVKFLLFIIIIVTNILFFSSFPNVYHNVKFSWGPRYAFVMIPFLFLSIGFLLENGFHKIIVRYFFKFLFGLGFLFQLPSILVNSAQMEHLFVDLFSKGNNIKPAIGMYSYNPNFSPIVNGYYQIASAFTSKFMNYHLSIPVYNSVKTEIVSYIPLYDIDFFDIWFANVLRIGDGGIVLKILTLTVIFILLCLIIYFLIKIIGEISNEILQSKFPQ